MRLRDEGGAMSEFRTVAEKAARAAGALLRENFGADQAVDAYEVHDIKLELDVRCQDLITEILLEAFPDHTIVGEEGDAGVPDGEFQWIVDPIDGTVNYFFGIPHFCVSIALRQGGEGGDMILGVIYEPMLDELWAAEHGKGGSLNGKPLAVSKRDEMRQAVVTVGFSKTDAAMDAGFQRYKKIAYTVRKSRMMGSAALAMAYISCGRLDAYIEEIISIWDIAAGQVLIAEAGGKVMTVSSDSAPGKLSVCATNGLLPLDDTFDA
jgi:myo-inositol-1(or 4)-monophosphatase